MRVSIDCWGTILKSSPTFTQEKINLVKKYFPDIDNSFILSCFESTKKVFNDVIENSGGMQPPIKSIFRYLLSKFNRGYSEFYFISSFINEYQKLALQSSPILYSEETITWIKKLSLDHKLLLSSNTMFIKGKTIQEILYKNGIGDYFDKFIFSDGERLAKPHIHMYLNSNYHIGDNPLTDGIGAENAGSIPIIINSTDLTIKDAYYIISKGR